MRVRAAFLAMAVLILVASVQPVAADVVPGEIIDKNNSEKIEGLVPDFILTWVKNGDMTLKIGKLSYDQGKFWSQEILDNWQANNERYSVDEHNGIIDRTTGKPARGIKGLPFPEPAPSDPGFPMKLMWNTQFVQYFVQGDMHEIQTWLSVTRRGLEKAVQVENLQYMLDPSKSQYDYAQLSVFRQPFNMAGTGSVAVYPMYPLDSGIRFGYAPELRRVKRLSHRLSGSDVIFGFDAAPDDSWAGGPKTNMDEGVYRFIREQDALVPYFSADPLFVEWTDKGNVEVGCSGTGLTLVPGFETEGWTGAPWHFTNIIWVKSPVWVIESRSTDPNYAYGPCEAWVEKGSFSNAYKRITDPNGNLWKGSYWAAFGYGTRDGKFRMIDNIGQVLVDIRRDHGSTYPLSWRKGGFKRNQVKDMNENLFTEAGFIKFSK